jgi:hypothetical protein
MEQLLGDRIQVEALFSQGKIIPRLFVWRGREYPVKRMVFSHRRQEGEDALWCFSVEGLSATYELEFNQKNFIWRLARVYLPGV